MDAKIREILPIPERTNPVTTSMGIQGQSAAFTPVEALRPPENAPNVVLVLIDDMGFGASSAFGGPCEMPTAERLSGGGLRYSRFHVTALCSPTRQALMTGRNHHSVGMGVTTEMTTSAPGYTGFRPSSAATIAQTLSGNGYSTAAFGKWHQTPPREVCASGPFDRWPTGEGFDKFYGFMGAEMNHWYPQLFDGTTPVEPSRRPEEGYHLSEDLVDNAIDWVHTQKTLTPDKPFFTYIAFGATHGPFHVGKDWKAKYRGRFDQGWNAQREETLNRQKQLGIVPESADLSPWADVVPQWDELDETERSVACGFMETYGAFAEHTDAQVGRFVDALDDIGELDNTLFIYILGDNGASGEGGIEGTTREHLVGHGFADSTEVMAAEMESLGDASTYAIYPVGWALAMNTPYQWTKQVASHYGGTRDGMIMHWGNGIRDGGGIRHQWHHVIDIAPTIFQATGVPHPVMVNGVTQQPIEGTSMVYTFNDHAAADRRRTQYFEMCGNRSIYHEGWTAVTRHGTPWLMVPEGLPSFEDDVWELYDTTTDWTQAHDVAHLYPEKLRELQQLFLIEASKYKVFPLDDRVTERENPQVAGRVDVFAGRQAVTYRAGMGRFTEETAPNVKNRSHRITAHVDIPETAAEGVIIAQGGRFGGWSLYVLNGYLNYAYNCYGRHLYTIRSQEQLQPGNQKLVFEFQYDGNGIGMGGDVQLGVDGRNIGRGRVEKTTAYYFSFDETLNIGIDRGTPVTDDYPALDNAFTGTIHTVRIDLDSDAPEMQLSPADHRRLLLAHQ
ncbi:arylsulfatase [Arthrobacter sp. VKM Ac-2550]|uniref:arylsulfatase n=1 Tax=Crystallibacter permensis TaxID=1938888 RepID=UPI002225F175|nr:arylsulfatase [Arthrobacter sp. VKM Ac-2550]MCW2134543.1 arylsulfatase [Arthrobacter sp. VKM Ac-2550]